MPQNIYTGQTVPECACFRICRSTNHTSRLALRFYHTQNFMPNFNRGLETLLNGRAPYILSKYAINLERVIKPSLKPRLYNSQTGAVHSQRPVGSFGRDIPPTILHRSADTGHRDRPAAVWLQPRVTSASRRHKHGAPGAPSINSPQRPARRHKTSELTAGLQYGDETG